MKRQDLFLSGGYVSLPYTILERTDLLPSAKCIWAALASHLGPNSVEVWPSMDRLGRMTGLNRRTVLRGIVSLKNAGLVIVEYVPGKSGRYCICQPSAVNGLKSEVPSDLTQNVTCDNMSQPPVTDCHNTCDKPSQPPVTDCHTNYSSEVPEEVPKEELPTTAVDGQSADSSEKPTDAQRVIKAMADVAVMVGNYPKTLAAIEGDLRIEGVGVEQLLALIKEFKYKFSHYVFISGVLNRRLAETAAVEAKAEQWGRDVTADIQRGEAFRKGE